MTHALIIGGGIAGATTAMALQKAAISSTVYEAYPSGGADIGAFLMIMHNGMDALRAIDAHEPVIETSFRTTRVRYFDAAGMPFTAREIGAAYADPAGPRTLTRAALYRALQAEWLRRGGRIEYGKRLSTASTTADGRVVAVFADGSRAEGDLLVGADGIHSTTRTLIDAHAPAPRFAGANIFYGYTDDTAIPLALDEFRIIHGSGVFGYTTSPELFTFWVATLPGAPLDRATAAATPPARWRERIVTAFAGDPDRTAVDIVRATAGNITASGIYDIPSLPIWHREAMVLVGDAAHAADPHAAQGASMALEDSVVLARCLRDLPTLPAAFSTYERIRRERVERLVDFSAEPVDTLDAAKHKAREDRRIWLFDHHIDWDAPIIDIASRT